MIYVRNNVGEQLLSAAKNLNLRRVKELVEQGVDVNYTNVSKSSALMFAAYNRDYEMAKYLISKGIDVNMQDPDGISALIMATFMGDSDIVELLISSGADANLKDFLGRKAKDFAKTYHNNDEYLNDILDKVTKQEETEQIQ